MKSLIGCLSAALLFFVSACSVIANPTPAEPGAIPPTASITSMPVEAPSPEATQTAADLPTAAPVEATQGAEDSPQGGVSAEKFDISLIEAIEQKDFKMLRALMGQRFVLAGWRSEGRELTAEDALAELSQGALSDTATPAASTGMDTVALLEGADPLNFFPPDAVRAIYFDFVGPNGTDQALAIVGRDPATGARYWKGMLVAMGGFRQENSDGIAELNRFSQGLGDAVLSHDFAALRSMMGSQFSIATLNPSTRDGSLTVVSPDDAISQLKGGLLASGSDPVILWNTDIPALLGGSDPLAQWGPNASPVRAMHISSMGVSNQAEAVLVIGREPSGRLYWHGILLPLKGETFQAGDTEPSGEAKSTSVKYVEALDELNVRSGPGANYAVEGRVREGEVAQVSGVSVDGGWWQIYCTQDSSGRCWISADAELTRPTSAH